MAKRRATRRHRHAKKGWFQKLHGKRVFMRWKKAFHSELV